MEREHEKRSKFGPHSATKQGIVFSISTDDYSVVCDELLEELEANVEKFSPKQISKDIESIYSQNRGGVYRMEDVNMAQVTDKNTGTIIDQDLGSKRCNGEYFDNLLLIIEKAAQGLSL